MANWFQEIGSLNLSEEMKYPEDRYHIRCTLKVKGYKDGGGGQSGKG